MDSLLRSSPGDQLFAGEQQRGRKTFAFWTLILLIVLLALGNLTLTTTILAVLQQGNNAVGGDGGAIINQLQFISAANSVKFFGLIDFGQLYKRDGHLEGYLHRPVEISSENGRILFNIHEEVGREAIPKFQLDCNGTVLYGIDEFFITDGERTVFNAKEPHFHQLIGTEDFESTVLEAHHISSLIDQQLRIEGNRIVVKGSEGGSLEAKEVIWTADQDITLKSTGEEATSTATINFQGNPDGGGGVYIDVARLPVVPHHSRHRPDIIGEYKICVCVPNGRLFRVAVPVGFNTHRVQCNHVDFTALNPCI